MATDRLGNQQDDTAKEQTKPNSDQDESYYQ